MPNKQKSKKKEKKSQVVAIRMSISMIKLIDAFGADLEQKTPGINITRADAIRVLVERVLGK